jgi:hypothetical protein
LDTGIETIFHTLIHAVAAMGEVQSIGRSGGRQLPAAAADGDIDVFIYCTEIRPSDKRRALLQGLGESLGEITIDAIGGGHWGNGDLVYINGVETWLMYFTMEEASAEVRSVLDGKLPDRLDDYYPIGRCAMLLGADVLCDKERFLFNIKALLMAYPDSLSQGLVTHHVARLGNVEDLLRAVSRNDVFFYHFALDAALDHYLQALFALNKVYFPSRKRSMEHIRKFCVKPEHSEDRLLEVVRLGGCPAELPKSYELWQGLVKELKALGGS